MNDKKFEVILADPPWHFKNYSADSPGEIHNRGRGAAQHYPTMTTSDICNLQIPATDNALLFIWACWPLLPDALRVIDAWGFEYKTIGWVWIKANKNSWGFFTGQGYYTRSNSEPCLLATRGKIKRPVNRSIQSLIHSPVRSHSEKPDDQYRKIEALYPGKRYLEMFARRKREGWEAWGNEVNTDVDISSQRSADDENL